MSGVISGAGPGSTSTTAKDPEWEEFKVLLPSSLGFADGGPLFQWLCLDFNGNNLRSSCTHPKE